jgi:hypothetical protein
MAALLVGNIAIFRLAPDARKRKRAAAVKRR